MCFLSYHVTGAYRVTSVVAPRRPETARGRSSMADKSQKKRSPKTNKPKLSPKQKKEKKKKKAGVNPAH
jgi:hypothetical protein